VVKRSAHHFPRHLHPSPTFKNSTPFISRPRNPPLLTPRPHSRKDAKTQRVGFVSLREPVVPSGAMKRSTLRPRNPPTATYPNLYLSSFASSRLCVSLGLHRVWSSGPPPRPRNPPPRYLSEPISFFLCVFASLREPGFPSGVVKRSTPSTAQPTTALPIRT
jgi:hypothetical protein